MTKRVLIIDDEPAIRMIVEISIKAIAGWRVLLAASGQEGIATAEAEQPDAILVDLMMPGMDGITTVQKIQAKAALLSIPIILFTAKSQIGEQEQFASVRIAGVIMKPFKAAELVQEIRSLLNWSE